MTKRTTSTHSSSVVAADADDPVHLVGAVGGQRERAAERRQGAPGRGVRGEARVGPGAPVARGRTRRNDCAGIASGANPGIDEPRDEPPSLGERLRRRERHAVHR